MRAAWMAAVVVAGGAALAQGDAAEAMRRSLEAAYHRHIDGSAACRTAMHRDTMLMLCGPSPLDTRSPGGLYVVASGALLPWNGRAQTHAGILQREAGMTFGPVPRWLPYPVSEGLAAFF